MNILEFVAETSIIEDNKRKEFINGFKRGKDFYEWIEYFIVKNKLSKRTRLFLERFLSLEKRILRFLEESVENIKEIKGDFHIHSNWSDGVSSIEELILEAKSLGYEYIVVTDHTLVGKSKYEMKLESFFKRNEEIEILSKKYEFEILKGIEVDINPDGSFDYPEEVLAEADFVLGAIHFDYGEGEKNRWRMFKKLINNPFVHAIAHPVESIGIENWMKKGAEIVRIVEESGKILELNLTPHRLKENDLIIKYTMDKDISFTLGTDSHYKKQLLFMIFSRIFLEKEGLCKERILNFKKWNELNF
ncbi:MAG TPA: PHP domain-containing protein [Thermotoga sp.]|nr:PHP domain-containing protein [Thermotoga sp.]